MLEEEGDRQGWELRGAKFLWVGCKKFFQELGRMICRGRKEAAMSTSGRKETAQGQQVSIHHTPAEGRTGLGGVAWRDRSQRGLRPLALACMWSLLLTTRGVPVRPSFGCCCPRG